MNMVADRTREGSHQATTSELWVTVASAPSARSRPVREASRLYRHLSHHRGYGPPAVEYTTGSAGRNTRAIKPPRIRRVPGDDTHPLQAGRPSKPSAFHGSDVAPCRARHITSLSAPPKELALGCGLHHLVASQEALRNEKPEHPVRPSSTYR